jgi:hypothetical protein
MKFTGMVRMFVLVSLCGATSLIYAQDPRDDAKPPQQEEPRPDANKPARHQDEAKPPKHDEVRPRQDEGKPSKQEARSEQSSEHARRGGRIPDDKFRSHFGRQHTLVIRRPTVVEGQPRFQYGGYWFTIVDPWPAGWAYTDDCYIDDIDGEYFLFDLLHPGVRVAIVVVL